MATPTAHVAAQEKAAAAAASASKKVVGAATEVIIHNAAFQEDAGEIVVRGTLAFESLEALRADDYQREVMARNSGGTLPRAIAAGEILPDIELSMRGQKFSSKGEDTIILHNPVYIVDGLQRASALKTYLETNGDEKKKPQPLGATIHFGHTKEWEKDRFEKLNANRVPVAPSVLLRNRREQHPSVLTLYGLSTNDPEFALYNRVTWDQRMSRAHGHLITGSTLARVARSLHASVNIGTGKPVSSGGGSAGGRNLAPVLDKQATKVGLKNFRDNLKTFFEIIDHCFGLRAIEYNQLSTQTKGNLLISVAHLFAFHEDFWAGNKLVVPADHRRRLKSFPISATEVVRLASAGSMAVSILFALMVEHMNKSRQKKNHLVAR